MFTDIYFTNLDTLSKMPKISFFQKNEIANVTQGIVFKTIDTCPFGWSHSIRLRWDLSFKFVKASGNISCAYPLKTVYDLQKTKFLIWKEGTVTVTQSYGNGNQIINFKQIKGSTFTGVQIYRGKYLMAEEYFLGNYLQFQINTLISITQNDSKNELQIIETTKKHTILKLDFVGLKEIHLSLKDTRSSIIHTTKKW